MNMTVLDKLHMPNGKANQSFLASIDYKDRKVSIDHVHESFGKSMNMAVANTTGSKVFNNNTTGSSIR
jgi:hypothetical protein